MNARDLSASRAILVLSLLTGVLLTGCSAETVEVTRVVRETVLERETVVETVVERQRVVETVVETVVQRETVVQQETVVETVIEERHIPVVVTETPAQPTPVPEVPAEKQMGGILNVWLPNGWPEQSWLHAGNWESHWAISPMAESLFWPKTDGSLEPVLATGWEVSDDGLVYTIHLRQNVRWHDGAPLSAHDYKYTMELGLSPERGVLNVFALRRILGLAAYRSGEADELAGLRVIDAHTFQYILESPDAAFPGLLLGGPWVRILPKHIIETFDREQVLRGTLEYWHTAPVGTGPYKFVRYEIDQFIEFERNEDYWGGPVGPEKLYLKIASPETAIIMLQKGELDLLNPLHLTEIARLEDDPGVEVLVAENKEQWYGLNTNTYTQDGLWRDPRAKQAFLYSIDRQAYVDSVLQGLGTVRHSLFDGTPFACPTMTRYDYDPQKADALWNEIGLDPEARAAIVIDLMSWLGIKARMDFLPIAQEYLRQTGFKANVDIIDNALILEYIYGEGPRGRDYDFHVMLWRLMGDPGSHAPSLTPGSSTNVGLGGWPFRPDPQTGKRGADAWVYENARITELLALAEVEADAEKRKAYFQEIDCILNEELPTLPIAAASFIAAKSKRMQGVDWQENAENGNWMFMYRPGDWWIWEH